MDREALAAYAEEYVKVTDLLSAPPQRHFEAERRKEYQDILYRQRAELLDKMRKIVHAGRDT